MSLSPKEATAPRAVGAAPGGIIPRPAAGSGGPSGQPPPRRIGSPRSFAAGRERQPSRTSIAPFVKQDLAGPSAYSARASQGRSLREGKRKPPEESGGKRKSRRLPIFPGRFQPSILGASGLNCRVRDGNGCTPTAIDTDYIPLLRVSYTLRTEQRKRRKGPQKGFCNMILRCRSSPRSISTAKLKTSPSLHIQPIYQVVFLGPYLITQWDI